MVLKLLKKVDLKLRMYLEKTSFGFRRGKGTRDAVRMLIVIS
jgi:hypothetical protein